MEDLQAQILVAGAGMAGICAALEAARQGKKVILVCNRPVLGGNSSSEIRVWTRGAVGAGNLFSEEMGIIGELGLRNLYVNPEGNPVFWDEVLLDSVLEEPNVKLLLNTQITDLTMVGDKIGSVTAYQMDSEKKFNIKAEACIDCTGDGSLCAWAGVPYEVGEMVNGSREVLGSTIMYYVRKEGHKVKFIPPRYAYSMDKIEQLINKGGRIVNEHLNGTDGWWFEYGGIRDTIADAQDISIELRRLVLGVWNYIKNSGRFDADCCTLEWIGGYPGKRESRRMHADYTATKEDVLQQRTYPDGVFFGGWYIDSHPAEGMESQSDNCTQVPVNVYEIPLRCLYNSQVENLYFAGRIIGVSREVFFSSRIMKTCALSGQAVAVLASECITKKCCPAGLCKEDIETIRHKLLKDDMMIPGFHGFDEHELAHYAEVSASSVYNMQDTMIPDKEYLLDKGAFITIPGTAGMNGELLIKCIKPTVLHGIWYAAKLPSRLRPGDKAGNFSITVEPGLRWIPLGLPEDITDMFYTLVLEPDLYTSVFTCKTYSVGFVLGRKNSPEYCNPCVKINKNILYSPYNVTNGYSRPFCKPNNWCSGLEKEPWLQLHWKEDRIIKQIRLYFDPNLSKEITSSHAKSWGLSHMFAARYNMPGQLVKNFGISILSDGEWKEIYTVKNNWRRMYTVQMKEPVKTNTLRITIQETWGEPYANIFEVRVY